jgi:hypothetical protein
MRGSKAPIPQRPSARLFVDTLVAETRATPPWLQDARRAA